MNKWAQTKQELQITKAIDGGIQISKFTTTDDRELLKFLGVRKIKIGDHSRAAKGAGKNDYLIMMIKLKELYPNITLPEIKLAADLCMSDKLDVSAQLYNNQSFSVLYCTRVINSYLNYKRENMTEVIKRYEMEPPPERLWTMEEKYLQQIEIFTGIYEKWLSTGIVEDLFNFSYHHLNDRKLIVMTKEEIKEAQDYGKKMALIYLKQQDDGMEAAFMKDEQKLNQQGRLDIIAMEKKFARNYCVHVYFKTLTNVKDFLKTVKPGEFVEMCKIETGNQLLILITDIPENTGISIVTKPGKPTAFAIDSRENPRIKQGIIKNLNIEKRKAKIICMLNQLTDAQAKEFWDKNKFPDHLTAFMSFLKDRNKLNLNPNTTAIIKVL